MKLKCPHAFPQHLLGLKCPPPPRGTFSHAGRLARFWGIHVSLGIWVFLWGSLFKRKSILLSWAIMICCKLVSAFSLSPFLSVLHGPSVPKGFYPSPFPSFAIFSGFYYLECSPQSAAVLFLFVSSPFLKTLFKSHLLHNGHAICLLGARCSARWIYIFLSQSGNQSCQRVAVILICQRVNSQRKLKSNLIPGSWVTRPVFSLTSFWLECLTPLCCVFFSEFSGLD